MTIGSRIVGSALAASLALGSMAPLASVSHADGWGSRQGAWQEARSDRRYRGFEQYRNPRSDYAWRDRGRDHWRDERREDRKDRKVARGIAIGLGVLMLGIMAAEAGRDRHDRYDY